MLRFFKEGVVLRWGVWNDTESEDIQARICTAPAMQLLRTSAVISKRLGALVKHYCWLWRR